MVEADRKLRLLLKLSDISLKFETKRYKILAEIKTLGVNQGNLVNSTKDSEEMVIHLHLSILNAAENGTPKALTKTTPAEGPDGDLCDATVRAFENRHDAHAVLEAPHGHAQAAPACKLFAI